MLSKTEMMKKKSRLLISELESENEREILDTVDVIENYIDSRIISTVFQNEHEIQMKDLKANILLNEGQFRKLLRLAICQYQAEGWSVAVSDDFLVLS